MQRRRLRDIELVGKPRAIRRGVLGGIIGTAAASIGLYLVEWHHTDAHSGWFSGGNSVPEWGPAHSLAGETHYLPVLAAVVVTLAAVWARRGFPRGLLPATLAMVNAVVIAGCWISAHLFDHTDSPAVTTLASLATLLLFVLGLAMVVVEIVLPIVTRKRLERADPVFPSARVVS